MDGGCVASDLWTDNGRVRLPAPLVRGIVRSSSRRIFDPRLTIEEHRRRVTAGTRLPPVPRRTVVRHERIGGVPCDVVQHRSPVPGRTVLHLHGGGFVSGSPLTHRAYAARLAAASGSTVVLPDYRLAPEHPWPAAVDDAVAVWRELADDPERRIVVAGDSAGGNLALQIALHARDAGPASRRPDGLALLSPGLDLADDRFGDPRPGTDEVMLDIAWSRMAIDSYAGDHDRSDPRLSPLNADLRDLPPLLVVWTAEELLATDAERLVAAARAQGTDVVEVVARNMWHVYPLQAGVCAESDHAVRRTASFVMACTSRRGLDVA